MCGRAQMTTTPDDLADWLGVDRGRVAPFAPRENIAPTDPMVVVRLARDGAPEATVMRWGLVPHWADDLREGSKHFNARSETVAQKPAFRDAFHRRRCVVVVDGFYEWKAEEVPAASGKKPKVKKVPHRIQAPTREPLALAGLWERWTSREGERVETCTVITAEARGVVCTLHDRMPVALPRAAVDRWLDPGARDDELEALLREGRVDFAIEPLAAMPVDPGKERPAPKRDQLSLFGGGDEPGR